MLTPDAVVILIKAQSPRGLMVPRISEMAPLLDAFETAIAAGYCVAEPHVGWWPSANYTLTEAGLRRFGEIVGVQVKIIG
jgi:hypothetical protein